MIGRLHVLTDARAGRSPLEVVAGALSGAGARADDLVVQVRAKGCTDRQLYDLAGRVAGLCVGAGALCVVDDRPDVAVAVGAGGTHLGASDLPLSAARRVVGTGHLLGGTTRTPVDAQDLVGQGADYLGVGPAYSTLTKGGLPPALGPAGIAAVAAAVDVPVIAIGGIGLAAVPELLAAGASGVAVVTAVSDAADPARAVQQLLDALGPRP